MRRLCAVALPGVSIAARPWIEADARFDLSPRAKRIIAERPVGWEYELFGALIADGIAQSDELRVAARASTPSIDNPMNAFDLLQTSMQETALCASSVETIFDVHRMQAAFGLPGKSGDAVLIGQVASDVVSLYEKIGISSDQLSAVGLPPRLTRFDGLQVRMNDALRRQIREFSDELSRAVARVPEMLCQPVAQREHVRLVLASRVDLAMQNALESELKYLAGAVGAMPPDNRHPAPSS